MYIVAAGGRDTCSSWAHQHPAAVVGGMLLGVLLAVAAPRHVHYVQVHGPLTHGCSRPSCNAAGVWDSALSSEDTECGAEAARCHGPVSAPPPSQKQRGVFRCCACATSLILHKASWLHAYDCTGGLAGWAFSPLALYGLPTYCS